MGDAFGRPLLDALRKRSYDLSSLRLLTSGGAILSATLKEELLELLPDLRILDTLGSSESGAQAIAGQRRRAAPRQHRRLRAAPDNVVLRRRPLGDRRARQRREGLARAPRRRAARLLRRRGEDRAHVPGDRAACATRCPAIARGLDAGGPLRLLGRDSVTINTGGEKVFAEEVEHALKHHPAVYDAVVVGTPHERCGQQVTALVAAARGRARRPRRRCCAAARAHLAAYKLPRRFVFVDEIVRAPSGKADYRWAKATRARESHAADAA